MLVIFKREGESNKILRQKRVQARVIHVLYVRKIFKFKNELEGRFAKYPEFFLSLIVCEHFKWCLVTATDNFIFVNLVPNICNSGYLNI